MAKPRPKTDITRFYRKIEGWIYKDEMVDLGHIGRKVGLSSKDFTELLTTDTQLRQAVTTGLIKLKSKFIQRIVHASVDKDSPVNVAATRAAISLCSPETVLPKAADTDTLNFDLAAYLNTGDENDSQP